MGWRSAHDKHGVKVKVKVGRKRRKISSEGVHVNGGVTSGIYFIYNYFLKKNG